MSMKSVKFLCLLVFILLLSMSTPLLAQLYHYTNENGVLVFTDDFSRVPAGQRAGLKVLKEIESENMDVPADDDASSSSGLSTRENASGTDSSNILSKELKNEADGLNQRNQKLKQTYKIITEKKETMGLLRRQLESKKNISRAELDAFNRQVTELNAEAEQYEADVQSHRNAVRAYKLKIEQLREMAGGSNAKE